MTKPEKELLRALAHRQIDEIVDGNHTGHFFFNCGQGYVREIRVGGEKGLLLMKEGRTVCLLTEAAEEERG